MFLVRFLRWLRGSVTFLVTGAFPERLLNLCIRAKLPIWGVHPRPNGYTANTYAGCYKRLRPFVKQSKTRVRLQSRQGWPFLKRRYRHRQGIAAGLVLAVVLMVLGSTRIWNIEVHGCEKLDAAAIETQLDALGLRSGVRAKSVPVRELEQRMILSEPRISWIAINIIGSAAIVEIQERVAPPERLDPKNRAANVVAACDGQIKYLEVYEGQALLKVGDTVLKGEVIVSGVTEDSHGNTRLKYARAKVLAQVYETMEVSVALEQTQLRPCGERYTARRLNLMGIELPLSLPRRVTADALQQDTAARILWDTPRITLTATETTPMERYTVTLTEFEAKEQAMRQLSLLEKERLGAGSVLTREILPDSALGVFRLTEQCLMEKDIAKQAEILFN